jgi:hypothetical protein
MANVTPKSDSVQLGTSEAFATAPEPATTPESTVDVEERKDDTGAPTPTSLIQRHRSRGLTREEVTGTGAGIFFLIFPTQYNKKLLART